MPEDRLESGLNGEEGQDPARIDELVTEYLDRLNAGDVLDPLAILSEHPALGPAILEQLETFVDLGPRPREQPLGTLGDYTLRRQIGQGGMGVVYEAWENSMDRRVALKVLPAGTAVDDKTFQRFMREARTAGRLNHPNVVAVYSVGIKEHTPYYAMEFVEGETLSRVLAKLKEAPPEAKTPFGASREELAFYSNLARAFAEVADGLQHAHSKGIIHRDIKPSNLILDGEGRLRILDFGLAHLEGQESLTLSGDFVGTPLYMSPEQARRKKIPLDHRTDIYSLGATLYEMLTLRTPFKGKDHQDTLSQIIERDPVEPRKLNYRIPKDLETIVLKCLRKAPDGRFGTAEALAQDLHRFVRGDPIEAKPQAAWERVARRAWRSRGKLALAAAVAVLFLIAGFFFLKDAREARRRREAEYEPMVLRAAVKMHSGSLGSTFWGLKAGVEVSPIPDSFMLEDAGTSSHLSPIPIQEALKDLDEAIQIVPRRPEARYQRAQALVLLGEQRRAIEELRRAVRQSPGFAPARALLASILETHGSLEESQRELDIARKSEGSAWVEAWREAQRAMEEKRWRDAVEAYGKLLDLEAGGRGAFVGSSLESLVGRGIARVEAGEYSLAVEDFARAEHLWRGWLDPVLLKAKAYYLEGKKDLADLELKRTWERLARKDDTAKAVIVLWQFLGDVERALAWTEKLNAEHLKERFRCVGFFLKGELDAAIEAGYRAIQLNPSEVKARYILAYIFMEPPKRDLAKAERLCRENIQLLPGQPWPYEALADVLLAQGRYEASLAAGAAALQIIRGSYAVMAIGDVHYRVGSAEEALKLYEDALALFPGNMHVRWKIGQILLDLGKNEEAIKYLDDSLRVIPSSFARRMKGFALERLGRTEEALEAYGQACRDYPRLFYGNQAFGDVMRLLSARGQIREGLAAAQEAFLRDPGIDQVHRALVDLLRSGALEGLEVEAREVIATLEKAFESGREDPRILKTLATFTNGPVPWRDVDKAHRFARLAWEKTGEDDLEAALILAQVFFDRGQRKEAVFLLEKALARLGRTCTLTRKLSEFREALRPDFASYLSIDAALEEEEIIPAQAWWQYFRGKSEPSQGFEWTREEFDDTGWERGKGGIGYGDGYADTVLLDMRGSYTTVYLRHGFEVADPSRYSGLLLSVLADDGFVAYLNGSEVARVRAGEPGKRLASSALASANAVEPLEWSDLRVEAKLLNPGENVLALQGLNRSIESSGFILLPVFRGLLRPEPEWGKKLLEDLRAVASGEDSERKLLYLEGRLLELEGKPGEAGERFERLAASDPEPILRLVECQRALGASTSAEERLRQWLGTSPGSPRELWDLWTEISLIDLKRSPEELLRSIPEARVRPELRWLFERIAAGEPIRIDCGGAGFKDSRGDEWGEDRFFTSGHRFREIIDGKRVDSPVPFEGDIQGADDDALYRTHRYFPSLGNQHPGYRIPLPPGVYQVRLHFAEVLFRAAGKRSFDVAIEGKNVIEDFDPFEAGFATAKLESFDGIEVKDGFLGIEFIHKVSNPMISGIEIERKE